MFRGYSRLFIKCFSGFFSLLLLPSCLSADIHSKLKDINQEHILQHWDQLNDQERLHLQQQVDLIDPVDFTIQRNCVVQTPPLIGQVITPFLDHYLRGSEEDVSVGKRLIAEGKVGCLIVAGGQGSRLGFEGPKGIFPISPVKQKTLFRLFAEKVLAAGRQVNRRLLVAIMTSPSNHADTIAHFKDNQFFGLEEDQVSFFSQDDLPLLDPKGNLFLESPSRIAAGPDGNAPSLKLFVERGVWAAWHAEGVRYLNYVPIDNPLADPFDAELVGFHHRHQSDLVIKCVARQNPEEKVGIILKKNGAVDVIEYSEISDKERTSRNEEGGLLHQCANISLFSFKMDFIQAVAKSHYQNLPYHKAWKAVKYLTSEGETRMADKPMAWKFEKFIFDVLPFAKSVKALLYPREECFAPLKNAQGADSPQAVREALQRSDRAVFEKVTGIKVDPAKPFEVDQQFYYPTVELLREWKGEG